MLPQRRPCALLSCIQHTARGCFVSAAQCAPCVLFRGTSEIANFPLSSGRPVAAACTYTDSSGPVTVSVEFVRCGPTHTTFRVRGTTRLLFFERQIGWSL
jgi:hypothetical protein